MIRETAHRLRRRLDRLLHPGGRGVMLLYHRVAEELSDPYGLCVTPQQFDEHIKVISEVAHPMRASDLAHTLHGRCMPDRAVCVTFDDGYVDNLTTAEPILRRYGVPGLVFVTTGAGGRSREFWWDELERILLQPGEVPDRLDLEIAGQVHRWTLGADRTYTDSAQQRDRGWRIGDEHAPTARHAVFRDVYNLIQPLDTEARTRTLDSLLDWAGCDAASVRSDRRAMRPDEVRNMVAGGIMDVGAHTVNHPALPSQPAHEQRRELMESKRDLESWTGREVLGFAYPYGRFDETAVAAARQAGFAFACSCIYRTVTAGTDLFVLPRIEVPAVDGETLRQILQWQLQ